MSGDDDLIRLYSQRILALAADIPLTERLARPQVTARRRSPLCGSTVTVDLDLEDGRVAAFGQDVRACALGQASASILARHVVGATREEIAAARAGLAAMLKAGGPPPDAPFDALEVLAARPRLQEPPRLDPARLGRHARGLRRGPRRRVTMIRTPRLLLRRARMSDLDDLHRIFADPRAMRYWDTPPHADVEPTRRWLAAMVALPPDVADDFVLERDGRVIGKAGCWRLAEVGFILHPDHWGQGLATEALAAAIPARLRDSPGRRPDRRRRSPQRRRPPPARPARLPRDPPRPQHLPRRRRMVRQRLPRPAAAGLSSRVLRGWRGEARPGCPRRAGAPALRGWSVPPRSGMMPANLPSEEP